MALSVLFSSVYCQIVFVVTISVLNAQTVYSDPEAEKTTSNGNKNLLIFGGNGFIGVHTLKVFLDHGYNVTCIHRNNSYWDWHSVFMPKVHLIKCDRDNDLLKCTDLLKIENVKFFAVLDFSGYIDASVMQSLQMFMHKFSYLVYVSTDSIYDIVEKHHSGFSEEKDGVFPTDKQVRNQLRKGKLYADRKLTSEVIVDLLSQDYNGDYSYAIVRIPDTFGPKDTTYRFWYYMTTSRLAVKENKPFQLPPDGDSQLISLAYVEDVANFIYQLVTDFRIEGTRKNQVYNLAYPEPMSMLNFVKNLWKELELDDNLEVEYSQSAHRLYPTVKSGPINVNKVLNEFPNFQFTTLSSALHKSVQFYLQFEKLDFENKEIQEFGQKLVEWGVFETIEAYHNFIHS